MTAPTYGSRWPTYARQWDAMQFTAGRLSEINTVAKRLVAAKARYQAVEKITGVPWYMIACIHEREASQNWNTQLAQGDPLHRKSTHVPAGMGPYDTWEQGAVAALKHDGLASVKDWRLEKIIYHWIGFNGWGYDAHGVPSPYVWGATSIQKSGKYVADGVWSSTAWDKQLGCAAMLKAMMMLDPSIQPVREEGDKLPKAPIPPPIPQAVLNKPDPAPPEVVPLPTPPRPVPAPQPAKPSPRAPSQIAWALLSSLFGRKA